MVKNKIKFTAWLSPYIKDEIEDNYKSDNCKSQSEYIEKAVMFYTAYLNSNNAGAFLPEALYTMLQGTLDNLAQRMGAMLYKLALEQNVCNHLLAEQCELDIREYELLRGRCVREVQSSNGRISFKDALQFQKTV